MPASRFGFECRLYYNAGTYASPTWTLVDRVRDAELTVEDDEVEVTTRADSGDKTFEQGLRMKAFEFDMKEDQADADYMIFLNAYLNRTPLEVLVLNGLKDHAAAQGPRMHVVVVRAGRGENLADKVTTRFRLVRTPNAQAATWYSDTGSSTTTAA